MKKIIVIIIIVSVVLLGIILINKNNNKHTNIENEKEENINITENSNTTENTSATKNISVMENTSVKENIINQEKTSMNVIKVNINNRVLDIKLENNSSVNAFIEKLKENDVIINAHDYGNFEKVGDLGFELPTNDEKITTEPGDLILYQGNQITLYYDTNTWSFTKLGKVQNVSKEDLKQILGKDDVTMRFSLENKN